MQSAAARFRSITPLVADSLRGELVQTVKVRLPAADLSYEMATMREWLDRNSCEPTKFKYDKDEDEVVVSIDFSD